MREQGLGKLRSKVKVLFQDCICFLYISVLFQDLKFFLYVLGVQGVPSTPSAHLPWSFSFGLKISERKVKKRRTGDPRKPRAFQAGQGTRGSRYNKTFFFGPEILRQTFLPKLNLRPMGIVPAKSQSKTLNQFKFPAKSMTVFGAKSQINNFL